MFLEDVLQLCRSVGRNCQFGCFGHAVALVSASPVGILVTLVLWYRFAVSILVGELVSFLGCTVHFQIGTLKETSLGAIARQSVYRSTVLLFEV